jgi:hypothetical protein
MSQLCKFRFGVFDLGIVQKVMTWGLLGLRGKAWMTRGSPIKMKSQWANAKVGEVHANSLPSVW